MDWHKYAREKGFTLSREHYVTECPKCEHHNKKFYIEINSGKSYCFHCKHSHRWGNSPQMEAVAPKEKTCNITIQDINRFSSELSGSHRVRALGYLMHTRHLDRALIEYFKLGYCPEEDAITIPEIRAGRVISLDYRYIEGDQRYKSLGERALYNYEYVERSESDAVIVTEGRIDALSAMQLSPGIPVIGLPNNSIIKPEYREIFNKFKKIYLALDNTPDTEHHIGEIALKLGKYKCYRVLTPSKDVNDLLALENAKDLWDRAIAEAKPVFEPIICSFDTVASAFKEFYFNEKNESISTGYPALDEITGGIRRGELTILTGYTGVGKSTLAVSIAVNLALNGHKAFIGSFELPWHSHVAPMVLSALLHRNIELEPRLTPEEFESNITSLKEWDMIRGINRVGAVAIDDIVESIRVAYKAGHRIVILDHLHYFVPPGDTSEEKANIDKALILFQKLVKQEFPDLAMILIAHPKQVSVDLKTGKVRALTFTDLKGSSRIAQDADNIWILNNLVATDDLIFEVAKSRSMKIRVKAGGKARVMFDKLSYSYMIYPTIDG